MGRDETGARLAPVAGFAHNEVSNDAPAHRES